MVDTQKTDMSQVVSATQQENLPLAGRRWESFALMTPNVTNDGGIGLGFLSRYFGALQPKRGGWRQQQPGVFLGDEGPHHDSLYLQHGFHSGVPVTSSNYSAELGQAAGGIVNAVTKSGTNALHGDLFYYLRYPSLECARFIYEGVGGAARADLSRQPVHQQQQFGGSVGGPVIKDKLFYFFTYDGSRKVNPISFTSTAEIPHSLHIQSADYRGAVCGGEWLLFIAAGRLRAISESGRRVWQAGLPGHARQPRERVLQPGQFQVSQLL